MTPSLSPIVLCLFLLLRIHPALGVRVSDATFTLKEGYFYEDTVLPITCIPPTDEHMHQSTAIPVLFGSISTTDTVYVDPAVAYTGCTDYGCADTTLCPSDQSTIGGCCDTQDCGSSSSFTGSSGTTSYAQGCLCPFYDEDLGSAPTCLDDSQPTELTHLASDEFHVYQVPITGACRHVKIDLTSVTGVQYMFTARAEDTSSIDAAFSTGSKGTVMCCAPADPHTLIYNNTNTLSLYIYVYGAVPGSYVLSVEEIDPTEPFYDSDAYYYFANVTLSCLDGNDTEVAQFMPVPDPGYAFFSTRSTPDLIAFLANYSLRAFEPLLQSGLSFVGDGSSYTRYALPTGCSFTWLATHDSEAASAPATDLIDVALIPKIAGECSYEDFLVAQSGVLAIISDDVLANVTSSEVATQVGLLAIALTTSDEYLRCVDLVENTLAYAAPLNVSVSNSQSCLYDVGSLEYATDPCCNSTVARLYECCVPRTYNVYLDKGGFAANDSALTSLCASPSCSEATLADYASYVARQRTAIDGCDAALNQDVVQLDALFSASTNIVSACTALLNGSHTCNTDADCAYSGVCVSQPDLTSTCDADASDTAFVGCLYDQLYASQRSILSEFTSEILGDLDVENRTAVVAAVLKLPVLQGTACMVRGFPVLDYTYSSNASACEAATQYCNWDPLNEQRRSMYACEEYEAIKGKGYCSLNCSDDGMPSQCASVTVVSGCYAPPESYSTYMPGWRNDTCLRIGGKQDPGNPSACYLPGTSSTSQSACAPMAKAPAGCVLRNITSESLCACTNINATYTKFAGICAAFQWVALSSSCVFIARPGTAASAGNPAPVMTFDTCVGAYGNESVQWFRGGLWVNGSRQTNGACTAQKFCRNNPQVNTEAECVACNASVCRTSNPVRADVCTNLTLCVQRGCTDFEFRPPYSTCKGGCVLPFRYDASGQSLACPTSTILPGGAGVNNASIGAVIGCYNTVPSSPLGCINGAVGTLGECTRAGGTWYNAASNEAECVSRVACRVGTVLASLNATECLKCGTQEALYEWDQFSVLNATWSSLVWTPTRELVSAGVFSNGFDRVAVLPLLAQFAYSRIAELTQTFLLCSIGRQLAAVNLLACDCGEPSYGGCYSSSARTLGYATLCTKGDSFYAPPVTITNNSTATCASLQIGLYASSSFQTRTVRIYSSLFLQSIVPDSYSVVKNDRDVIVGQIIGDVVQIQQTAPFVRLLVCIELRYGVKPAFKVLDFATISSAFDAASIVPLSLDGVYLDVNTDDESVVCAVVTPPCNSSVATCTTNYLPVYRSAKWQNARFIDTLSNAQVNAFFVAAALYWILFVACIYRVVNFVLWYFLKPQERVNLLGLIVLSVLSFFFFLRGIYFVLVPVGVMRHAPIAVDVLMAELPTYLFFTVFTLMVLWWVQLYHDSGALQTSLLGSMYPVFIGVNLFLYAFLIAVVIVVAVRSRHRSVVGSCDAVAGGLDQVSDRLSKAYKIVVSVFALVLALAFLVYGSRLVILLRHMTGKNDSKTNVIKFAVVTAACSLGLILQCALLLYSTFTQNTASKSRTVVALVLLLLIELLPGAVLVATMRQPRASANSWLFANVLWCWAESPTFSTSSRSGRL